MGMDLLLFALAQSERVVAGAHLLVLGLSTVEFDYFVLELLAVVFDLFLLFCVVFLQLIELGVQLQCILHGEVTLLC